MAFLPPPPLFLSGSPRMAARSSPLPPAMALRGRTPEQRDAELQAQREVLERRRSEKAAAKYMDSVLSRRAEAEAGFQANQLDIQPGEDPLEAWKRKEARGLIKPLGYEDVPEGGIPLPAASFGIPKYDNGERTYPGRMGKGGGGGPVWIIRGWCLWLGWHRLFGGCMLSALHSTDFFLSFTLLLTAPPVFLLVSVLILICFRHGASLPWHFAGFDLRLPHVEVGYEDPEADVMGKVARFFGFGKKPKGKPEEKE